MSWPLGTRVATLLVAAALLGAACTDDGDDQPAPTTQPTTPTTVVDRSGIALAGVAGETTTSIVQQGSATIAGAVQGPGGLVPGAIVRIERIVGDQEVRTDVVAGPDGRYVLAGVPGGRYRLRAFLPPSLVQLEPEIRFLRDGEEHGIDLTVEQQGGLLVRADASPEPPSVGDPVNLVAVVSTRTVDADGIVRAAPVSGVTVELLGLGRWELRSSPSGGGRPSSPGATTTAPSRTSSATARTDGAGQVRFELVCVAAGAPGLSLSIPVTAPPPADPTATTLVPQVTSQRMPLELPECVAPPPSTTSTAPASTVSSSTTSP